MIIKDNILSPNVIDHLEDVVLGSNFPWYFTPNSAFDENRKINKGGYHSFSHLLARGKENYSNYTNIFNVATMDLQHKFDLHNYKIFRLRLGLQVSMGKEVINPAHVDDPVIPHKSCILYLNESDGDTCFYKEGKIFKRVSPVKNRAVLFDGSIYHSSSKPIKYQNRIILNINFIEKNVSIP